MTTDETLRRVARRAGLSVDWTDQSGRRQTVAPEALRRLLIAIGLDCDSDGAATAALERLDAIEREPAPLVTALAGRSYPVDAVAGSTAKLTLEDGVVFEFALGEAGDGKASARPILEPGYHRLSLDDREITIAVSPGRGRAITDFGRRMWGLAAQVYGLTRKGDGGIGDLGGVAGLAEAAALAGADALALSPMHAGFSADPHHFGPYSPSSRLFLNPLHGDPDFLFGEARVAEAAKAAKVASDRRRLERDPLIDWPAASRAKLATLRALYDSFRAVELADAAPDRLASDFAAFRRDGGDMLEKHAIFETIHAARFGHDPGQWDWRGWPAGLREPDGSEVAAFAHANAAEVTFHVFLQWITDRSFGEAQRVARKAGMSVGLISDLAVGMDAGGSHAWSRQQDVLVGLSVGSPPDLFNPNGQGWGLATFSPIGLRRAGFEPFLATLRASMRNAGGVRIDHAMGLQRLWVAPAGAPSREGAYLAFPVEDMLRLTALESLRNDAVVIGEDLGTVPEGFREKLATAGIAGMKVLQFERSDAEGFFPPRYYPADALAMTTTHDLPTIAGWWSGADIDLRASIGGVQFGETFENDRATRESERGELWRALDEAGVAKGERPPNGSPAKVVDAAVRFLAATSSKLALLPLEDALGEVEQPNLPGTLDEHPNWRRRLRKTAAELIAEPIAAARLSDLSRRKRE